MSHIPESAMPHAKSHQQPETPAPVATPKRFPWLAAAGGLLAIGVAVGAAVTLRPIPKPARRRATTAKRRRRTAKKD